MDPELIIPLGIAVFLILIFSGYAYGKRRVEAFQRFARHRGMSFTKKADRSSLKQFNGFELIPDNTINSVSNIIQGNVDGISVMICDVRITKLTGNTSMPTHQKGHTVAILQEDQIDLPFFTMNPSNIIYKMLRTLGKQTITFPSHPEFSDTYVLKGDDENAVRKSFHDRAVSYFVNHKELSIEGRGNRLLYFRFGKLLKPEELNSFLSEGMEAFRLFE